MNVFLLGVLLCSTLLVHTGQPLICHSCLKFTNITECNMQPQQECTENEPYCKIIQEKTGVPGIEMFSKVTTTKGCASIAECSGEAGSIWLPKVHIRCCAKDLCNTFQNIREEENLANQSYANKMNVLTVFYTFTLGLCLSMLHL